MSAPLIPNLFDVCKVLTQAIIWVVDQLIYAIAVAILGSVDVCVGEMDK